MIRLLLVEPERLIGRGFSMWLRQVSREVFVVGEAESPNEALVLARDLAPDVVLLDLAAPRDEAIATTIALRAAAPESAVVLLSLHDDATRRRDALAAGAYAFVGKQEGVAALLRAIQDAGRSAGRSAGAAER
jgi:two-component system response regulator NreC